MYSDMPYDNEYCTNNESMLSVNIWSATRMDENMVAISNNFISSK